MMRLVSAWVLVNGLLVAPAWVWSTTPDAPPPPWISLESAVFVALVALVARRPRGYLLSWVAVLCLVLASLVAFADVVFRVSLARPLNLALDLYLLNAVYRLAVGNSGLVRTLVGGAGVLLGLVVVTTLLAWLLTPRRGTRGGTLPRLAYQLGGLGLAVTLALGIMGRASPTLHRWVATPLLSLASQQTALLLETRRERREFAAEIEESPDSYENVPDLLARLQGRNVLLVFIESYGMATLEDPEFAVTLRPRLDTLGQSVAEAGLAMASAALVSPTLGGQSWYAHGTVISGLWLSNQLRYDLLIASDRETMVDDFRRAGYKTVALMPAITTPWPEGIRLGYEEVYTRPNIPYRGPPLYWVTMPDQFTWSFLNDLAREEDDRPVFVEAAMVSSHAPWTPVLPMVSWDGIGDGSAFEPYRQEGHPPEELWVDIGELRSGYRESMDYSLKALEGFAERYVDDETLLIVMGDHQAAPWVTGAVGAAVPAHVIAADSTLLDPFLAWGFQKGAVPPTGGPTVASMDAFRDWFVRSFSGAPHTFPSSERERP